VNICDIDDNYVLGKKRSVGNFKIFIVVRRPVSGGNRGRSQIVGDPLISQAHFISGA
jgi:hypothetical protein